MMSEVSELALPDQFAESARADTMVSSRLGNDLITYSYRYFTMQATDCFPLLLVLGCRSQEYSRDGVRGSLAENGAGPPKS